MFPESLLAYKDLIYYSLLAVCLGISIANQKYFELTLQHFKNTVFVFIFTPLLTEFWYPLFVLYIILNWFIINKINTLELDLKVVKLMLWVQIGFHIITPLEWYFNGTLHFYNFENYFQLLFLMNISELLYINYRLLEPIYERNRIGHYFNNVLSGTYKVFQPIIQIFTRKDQKISC